ncbi:hypothetical protein [Planotetraspora sp. GP83]|uniref:hypothetical protein n=1 Tax=Planotetraspora sp. GP83 TaxID=3156264 RepID=UPI003519BE5E
MERGDPGLGGAEPGVRVREFLEQRGLPRVAPELALQFGSADADVFGLDRYFDPVARSGVRFEEDGFDLSIGRDAERVLHHGPEGKQVIGARDGAIAERGQNHSCDGKTPCLRVSGKSLLTPA